MAEVTTHETWGLRLSNGQVLSSGYSGRVLSSEAEVRADFAPSVFADGAEPVLLARAVVTRFFDPFGRPL